MLTIRTKEQLKKAKKMKVEEFVVIGKLAEDLKKAEQIKNLSKKSVIILGAAVGAGAAAAPFTFGSSMAVSTVIAGAATGGLTAATISAAITVGGIALVFSIYKNYEEIDAKVGGNLLQFRLRKKQK
ncbi:hypothetical protein [Alkalicoccobacillus gibsonii]|uniref:hypothetical protein n=1 Tax=Alkalicoccobacillus gibsonii TaxID=79881 RepID=UPI0019342A2F|nr:hypothetical protein [Alkalicoccobacillus gibsonii]MBM0065919.1 hypothetical protein [Alkalicoccobacillus gibsonii]